MYFQYIQINFSIDITEIKKPCLPGEVHRDMKEKIQDVITLYQQNNYQTKTCLWMRKIFMEMLVPYIKGVTSRGLRY